MRRIAVAGVVLAVAGLWFWVSHYPDAPESSEPVAKSAAPVMAPEPSATRSALSQAALIAPKGELTISGTVKDAGRPVSGAVVVATRVGAEKPLDETQCTCEDSCGLVLGKCGCGHATKLIQDRLEQIRDAEQPYARAETSADGAFVLKGLESGSSYVLWSESGDRVGFTPAVASGSEGVEIKVEPGRALEVKVLTGKAKAVNGAQVLALFASQPRAFEARTGDDGRARFAALPAGDYVVLASAEGLVTEHARVEAREPKVQLHLAPPMALAGLVTREGSPVAGARVTLVAEHVKHESKTDEKGAFSQTGLPAGDYEVTATEGADLAVERVFLRDTGPQKSEPVELELVRGGTVEGTVADESGAPVSGATVNISGHALRTDAAGRFSTGTIPAGHGWLSVEAEGFQPLNENELTLEKGATVTRHLVLGREAPLSGIVVDARGHAVANASIMGCSGWIRVSRKRENATDEKGAFSVKGARPGPCDLIVEHDRFPGATVHVTAPATDVRIVLADGARITGRVLDEKGAPVPAAFVAAMPDVELFGRDRKAAQGETREARSEADGSFVLEGLSPAKYAITAADGEMKDGHAPAHIVSRSLEVGTSDARVELQFAPTFTISGRVVDQTGKPVAEAHVRAEPSGVTEMGSMEVMIARLPGAAESAEDGSFTVRGLHPGTYALTAMHGDFAWDRTGVEAKAGASDVILTLVTKGAVKGRVVDRSGAPVTEFFVNGRRIEDAGGAFSQQIWRDGEQVLVISAKGFAPARRVITAKKGVEASVGDVVLGAGRTITGVVLARATGQPVAGAVIGTGNAAAMLADDFEGGRRGHRDLPPSAARATSGPDGRFTLAGVEEGPVELTVVHDGFPPLKVQAPEGKTELTVALEEGGAIAGRAMSADGKPLEGYVTASAGPTQPGAGARTSRDAKIEADGSFELKALPPGSYTVRFGMGLSSGGSASLAPKQVQVEAGAVARVDFIEEKGGSELKVEVVGPSGGPVPGIASLVKGDVAAPSSMDEWRAIMRTAVRGGRQGMNTSVFRGVAAGRYTIVLMSSAGAGMGTFVQAVDVDGQTARQVKLQLPEKLKPLQFP